MRYVNRFRISIPIVCIILVSCSSPSDRNASNISPASSQNQSAKSATNPKTSNYTGPKAIEVADVLKKANVYPKDNQVSDTTNSISEIDQREGVVSSAVLTSSQPEGVTVKVYQSTDERNQARLRMIKDCPGCVAITECGPFLLYEQYTKAPDMNKILRQKAEERYEALKRRYKCD